jgi:NTE family protein
MGNAPGRLRPMATVLVRASADLARLAAEFVRSPAFEARNRNLLGRLLRRMAEVEGGAQADLVSYLLFDGQFAGELIALGRADARRQHEELCGFFDRLQPAL